MSSQRTSYGLTSTSTYGLLEVPIVANGHSPDDGDGICWAASVASIGAYRTNSAPLSAVGMYNAVKRQFGRTPTGILLDARHGFEYFGLDYLYSLFQGKTYDVVKRIIRDLGKPIYAGLSRTGGGHAVVICGYQEAQGGYHFYTLMDCNKSNYVTVSVSTNSTNFTYAAGTYTYTKWDEHIY